MQHEKSKRPPSNYMKLDPDEYYAVTWLTSKHKLCKVFPTAELRKDWLESEEAKIIGNNFKLKLEDGYICKSKLSPVYEYINQSEISQLLDMYTLAPNDNALFTKRHFAGKKNNAAAEKRGKAKQLKEDLERIRLEADDNELDCIELKNDLLVKRQEIDDAIKRLDEAIEAFKSLRHSNA